MIPGRDPCVNFPNELVRSYIPRYRNKNPNLLGLLSYEIGSVNDSQLIYLASVHPKVSSPLSKPHKT